MRSLIRVDHIFAHYRRFPLKYSRNFSSNEFDYPPLEQHPIPFEVDAVSLIHYSNLPPLPPAHDWLSHFPHTSLSVRDRISIRNPASAIRLAHSFIDSKKTSTGNPKVVIEAFPGASTLMSRRMFFYGHSRSRCLVTGISDAPAVQTKKVNNLGGPRTVSGVSSCMFPLPLLPSLVLKCHLLASCANG